MNILFKAFIFATFIFSYVTNVFSLDNSQQAQTSNSLAQNNNTTTNISLEDSVDQQVLSKDLTETSLKQQVADENPNNLAQNINIIEYNAVITKIEEEKVISQNQTYQKLQVKLKTDQFGNIVDKNVTIENGINESLKNNVYKVDDKVKVTANTTNNDTQYFISDYIRTDAIYILFALFIVLSVLIAGKMAIRSLFAMFITFVVIFGLLLPQISSGANSFLSIIVFAVISIPVNFYLSHGINYKTSSAVIGTFVSLLITILLATFFVNYAHLTGFTTDEAMFLQIAKGVDFNIKGLLLASIIIGIVGVLDDITVSQASIVYQLKNANKKLNFLELFNRSMEVGKDHISSLINTLVLVYAGASLPLLLLFIDSSNTYSQVLNYEIVASEIIRTLIGSIGLVIAVPITTIVTAVFAEVFEN